VSSSTSITTVPVIDTEPFVAWSEIETGSDGQWIRSVAATSAGFVAIGVAADGTEPRWWRSAGGTEWTSAPLDLPGFVAGQELVDLRVGGAGFLLAGTSDPTDPWAEPDLAWISSDGVGWAQVVPEDLAGIPRLDPSFRVSGLVAPVAVSDVGFLVRGGFRAQIDVEALVAEWFPEAEGTAFSVRPGAELGGEFVDVLIVFDQEGQELGRISGDDLGFPWGQGEALLEGVSVEGLWFGTDGQVWEEVTTGPGGVEFGKGIVGSGRSFVGEIGPGIIAGCGRWFYAAGNIDTDPPQVRTWRSGNGLTWEELTIEGPEHVYAMTCIGESAAIGTGFEGHAVWIAGPTGGWEQWEGTALGVNATPDLFGGPAGLMAGERVPQASCVDEPCQFLPDIRLTFTTEGGTWSVVERGSGPFGTNAVVRSIAVGGERILAITEHPMEGIGQPGPDPTRVWAGMPGTQPAGTATPEPELVRNVEILPDYPRFFATEPQVQFLIRVSPESPIDRVEVNGEPTSPREINIWSIDYVEEIPLDPGLNTLDIAVFGPGIEEHTVREVTYLPDAEERYAQITAVTPGRITVDWIEVDESTEFLSFADNDPGVLEQILLSDDVIVMVSMAAVPFRYFIDQWTETHDGAGLRSSDWIIRVHEGTVVEMLQVVWG
jgi:hypothetical protein